MPYLGLIYLVILVIALIDIITTDDTAVRGLPKFAWVILVVMLPLVGALVWLAVGRPTADERPRRQHASAASEFPEYDHPGRYIPQDPEADREFLQQLRDRAEQQRQTAREQQRAADRSDRPDDTTPPPASV
ncbi:PLD nuclease N-terminal domain-containing protein [Gordonia sp. SMJS1]|uniref:PLD nuclease N-terminal domain-containing protein n=1 Tax=Gordonia sp. SMJS1 TaxID=3039400 RepID=UPI0024548E95|nr:PLD nuclease N-terminal domain-containing protein [Gordonia sp. SMJS1]WGJ88213.1 PLD nuclease N-terminal domain-containing protein [Gordonia sp. SMJS1]